MFLKEAQLCISIWTSHDVQWTVRNMPQYVIGDFQKMLSGSRNFPGWVSSAICTVIRLRVGRSPGSVNTCCAGSVQ